MPTLEAYELLIQRYGGLQSGGHGGCENGVCVMEARSILQALEDAGEPLSCVPKWEECLPDFTPTDHPNVLNGAEGFLRGLNDAPWSSDEVRADAMAPFIIKDVPSAGFETRLTEGIVRRLLPAMFYRFLDRHPDFAEAEKFREVAKACEDKGGSSEAAEAARAAEAAEAARAAEAAEAAWAARAAGAAEAAEAAEAARAAWAAEAAEAAWAAGAADIPRPDPDFFLHLAAQIALDVWDG